MNGSYPVHYSFGLKYQISKETCIFLRYSNDEPGRKFLSARNKQLKLDTEEVFAKTLPENAHRPPSYILTCAKVPSQSKRSVTELFVLLNLPR